MRAFLLIALAVALTGCRSTIAGPGEVNGDRAYQTIANALPDADFGFGDAPAVVDMAPSVRREGPPPKPDMTVSCNDETFTVRVELFRPGTLKVPYEAIESIHARWLPFPNIVFAIPIVLPLQAIETVVVLDTAKLPGFIDRCLQDAERLERLSGEIAIAAPYYHGQQIRTKLKDDRAEWGEGRVSLGFVRWVPVPPWIPYLGPAERLGQAFQAAKVARLGEAKQPQ